MTERFARKVSDGSVREKKSGGGLVFVGARAILLALVMGALLMGCARRPPHSAADRSEPTLSGAELYRTGCAYLASGDYTRAEQYLASALRAGHDAPETMRALLSATVRGSRLRSALSYAEPYLVAHPRDVALRQLVASIHLALGQLTLAERELAQVLRMDEARPEAHYLLAVVLERRGAPERLTALARYLELAPDGPHAEEARAALEAHAARERLERQAEL
jgi:Tfp pilus assembly protein PilF